MLRVSGESTGNEYDVSAITDPGAAAGSGIRGAEGLVALAEAVVTGSEEDIAKARARVQSELGDAAMVDATAVAANFQRMVRIADGSGIPLDAPLEAIAGDMTEELGIDQFPSARNTPRSGPLRRALLGAVGRLGLGAIKRVGRRKKS